MDSSPVNACCTDGHLNPVAAPELLQFCLLLQCCNAVLSFDYSGTSKVPLYSSYAVSEASCHAPAVVKLCECGRSMTD
eukprot:1890857-Amphidinium_carterae.1